MSGTGSNWSAVSEEGGDDGDVASGNGDFFVGADMVWVRVEGVGGGRVSRECPVLLLILDIVLLVKAICPGHFCHGFTILGTLFYLPPSLLLLSHEKITRPAYFSYTRKPSAPLPSQDTSTPLQ